MIVLVVIVMAMSVPMNQYRVGMPMGMAPTEGDNQPRNYEWCCEKKGCRHSFM